MRSGQFKVKYFAYHAKEFMQNVIDSIRVLKKSTFSKLKDFCSCKNLVLGLLQDRSTKIFNHVISDHGSISYTGLFWPEKPMVRILKLLEQKFLRYVVRSIQGHLELFFTSFFQVKNYPIQKIIYRWNQKSLI